MAEVSTTCTVVIFRAKVSCITPVDDGNVIGLYRVVMSLVRFDPS